MSRFHEILAELEARLGGTEVLTGGRGKIPSGARGVYFFLDRSEARTDSGVGARVVRVDTHSVSSGSKTTLWQRLRQHRGTVRTGGGNHQGSVFRLLVGEALISRDGLGPETWVPRSSAPRNARASELGLEIRVSESIRGLSYVWLRVEDEPGPRSLWAYLERNSIALLSNWRKPVIDAASEAWLGNWSHQEKVSASTLWNSNHANEFHDPGFLRVLNEHVRKMRS